MEKATLQHACGHTATHGLSGSQQDREIRRAWLERQPCQACWRAAQLGIAQSARSAAGLPPLAGSAEEIAWAEVLRAKTVAHNREYYARLLAEAEAADDPAFYTPVLEAGKEALSELENAAEAAWWLAHRFNVLDYVKHRAAQAIPKVE